MSESIFYTYKYVWDDGVPYYVGKGKGDRAFAYHGEIPVPEDRNRIIFLIENVTEKEALQHEKDIIKFYGRKDLGTGSLLNKTSGGQGVSGRVMSEEEKEKHRIIGKVCYKKRVGVHGRSPEQMSEDGKKAGKASYEKGAGIHGRSPEQMAKDSKKAAQKCKENGTGIFGMTSEELSEAGKKGGKIAGNRCKENKTGVFGLTLEEKSKAGKKGGNKTKENKTGIFGLSPEERSENSKKSVKVTNSQKWQCTETGYVSTPGPLTRYQKKRGINPAARIRV